MRPPCMTQDFHRIKRLPPYVFAEVNALKSKARAAGEDIIDFGMGNPDQPPPQHVIDKLAETLADPRAHRYSTSRGIPGLRRAPCAYRTEEQPSEPQSPMRSSYAVSCLTKKKIHK